MFVSDDKELDTRQLPAAFRQVIVGGGMGRSLGGGLFRNGMKLRQHFSVADVSCPSAHSYFRHGGKSASSSFPVPTPLPFSKGEQPVGPPTFPSSSVRHLGSGTTNQSNGNGQILMEASILKSYLKFTCGPDLNPLQYIVTKGVKGEHVPVNDVNMPRGIWLEFKGDVEEEVLSVGGMLKIAKIVVNLFKLFDMSWKDPLRTTQCDFFIHPCQLHDKRLQISIIEVHPKQYQHIEAVDYTRFLKHKNLIPRLMNPPSPHIPLGCQSAADWFYTETDRRDGRDRDSWDHGEELHNGKLIIPHPTTPNHTIPLTEIENKYLHDSYRRTMSSWIRAHHFSVAVGYMIGLLQLFKEVHVSAKRDYQINHVYRDFPNCRLVNSGYESAALKQHLWDTHGGTVLIHRAKLPPLHYILGNLRFGDKYKCFATGEEEVTLDYARANGLDYCEVQQTESLPTEPATVEEAQNDYSAVPGYMDAIQKMRQTLEETRKRMEESPSPPRHQG